MKLFSHKYNQSQLWLENAKVREAKKELVQVVVQPKEVLQANYGFLENKAEVIFTNNDKGHNQEETNKIQKIYEELKYLSWAPEFAV